MSGDNPGSSSAEQLSTGPPRSLPAPLLAPPGRLAAQTTSSGFASVGAVSLAHVLHPDWVDQLQREAKDRREVSRRTVRERFERFAGGKSMRSPSTYRVAQPGPRLHEFHAHAVILRFLQLAVGAQLTPTRAADIYYGPGDSMGLHTDAPACFLTMLLAVGGEPPR